MRILIYGSRDFVSDKITDKVLDKIIEDLRIKGVTEIEIVSGTAKGADQAGERYAERNNLEVISIPAEWDRDGKAAGFIRNAELVKACDLGVGFWDGKSKGTKHTTSLLLKERKLHTMVIGGLTLPFNYKVKLPAETSSPETRVKKDVTLYGKTAKHCWVTIVNPDAKEKHDKILYVESSEDEYALSSPQLKGKRVEMVKRNDFQDALAQNPFSERGDIEIVDVRTFKGNYYVAHRGGILGNPYPMKNESERDKVCDKYEAYLHAKLHDEKDPNFLKEIAKLATRHLGGTRVRLGCYCAPKRCHCESIRDEILRFVGSKI